MLARIINNKHVHSLMIYGVSTGIRRGMPLIYLPLLVAYMSVADYGAYCLVQVIATLLSPILVFNGHDAILREGLDDIRKGLYLLKRYIFYSVFLFIPLLMLVGCFTYQEHPWITLCLVIGYLEGVWALLFGFLRALDVKITFLFVSLMKTLGLLILYAFFIVNRSDIVFLLQLQVVWTLASMIAVAFWLFSKCRISIPVPNVKNIISYAFAMLPRLFCVWILSSADRVILKYITGNESVGMYSIAYNLALVLMILNSGLTMTLPDIILKKYQSFCDYKYRAKIIYLYTVVAGVVALIMPAGAYILGVNGLLFSGYYQDLPLNIAIISAGLYMMFYYYIFSGYFFYHKKGLMVSLVTWIITLVNIPLTILLVYYWNYLGASIATFLSYALLGILMCFAALKLEPALRKDFWRGLWVAPVLCLIVITWGGFLSY